eukprot:15484846-Alexandrium_andersonii.AAC.1
MFRRFQVLDKDASPCGACWGRSLIHIWNADPSPFQLVCCLDLYLVKPMEHISAGVDSEEVQRQ